jgi:glycosyltransferase involved in cell wall biosynthesis
VRVAYITSRYPAVSHTFVLREVQALRTLGVEVDTFSVRVGQALSGADEQELASTTTLVPPRRRDVLAAALLGLRHAGATWTVIRDAMRASAGGIRGALWQLFYVAEALLLARELRRRGIDHVHAHFANVASDVARLATAFDRASGRPGATWSFTMHGPTEFADVQRFGLATKAAEADLVVCISDYARSQLMALIPESRWDRLAVVHCGIDPSRFTPAARPVDRAAHVLCVGRLVPEKGQALLVEAVALLAERGVDVRLTLVGDGPSRPAIEALAGPSVTLTGAIGQDDILRHYQEADIFCLPSFAEGVPVVLMEAMATGLPVVTTRITGVPELVEDGVSGVLVPPGRVDLLADALQKLASDPELRRRFGDAGRAAVVAGFDADRSAAQLRELFAAACSHTSRMRTA